VKAGTRISLPAEGAEWFQLDDARGKETVLVIASLKPINDLKETLTSLQGKSHGAVVKAFADRAAVKTLSFNHR
jgi:hypothetical protein